MALTIFGTMNTATTGMMTSQTGINVTSNNISNVNTPGYSRRRIHAQTAGEIYYRGAGYIGTGSTVSEINRVRDQYLEAQIRQETSKTHEYIVKEDVLSEIEFIFNEPSDTGLNAMMSKFWSSLEELSKHPDNATLHTSVIQSSSNLADLFVHLKDQLNDLSQSVGARLEQQIDLAVSTIDQLNQVNEALERAYRQDPTQSPNELLDQRDNLTRQLSEIMPITVKENVNGTVTVIADLAGQPATANDVLSFTRDDIVDNLDNFTSGTLKGYVDSQVEISDNYLNRLNQMASTFADEINKVQGFDFFTYDPANPAGTLKVNDGLLSGQLSINVGPNGAGDNSVVLEMLKIRNQTFKIGQTDVTFEQYFKQMISDLGISSQHAKSMVQTQDKLLTYLDTQYLSISGVSMDEEIVNLVQYQKAYDANAKVIATLTDMLDTIINRMGA